MLECILRTLPEEASASESLGAPGSTRMRAWGLEDTRDRQAGQEGGGPEGSIAPLRARQELLGITLKALQTSPLLEPKAFGPWEGS